MTSPHYGTRTAWKPLSSDHRRWETSTGAASSVSSPLPRWAAEGRLSDSDFAAEAAYTANRPSGGVVPGIERPEPPRLRDHHVWGVREDWGPGAARWGQGAKVHDKGDSAAVEDESKAKKDSGGGR